MKQPDAPIANASGHYVVRDGLDQLRQAFKAPPADLQGPVDLGVVPVRGQAEWILDRLHHRCSLDHDPGMNERMFWAGRRYEELVHLAGLSGIAAQNLLSCGCGSGDPAHSMAASESAANARKVLRRAWAIMGAKVAGAVHGMIVEGKDAASVGRETSSYVSQKECATAGLTTLRIGLWMLVAARWA